MSTRVVPFIVGNNVKAHVIVRGHADACYFLVAADVKRLVALKETTYYRVQRLAIDALDEASRADALMASCAHDMAALLAAGALDPGATHCKLVSLELAKALFAFSAAPLTTAARLQRAIDDAVRRRHTVVSVGYSGTRQRMRDLDSGDDSGGDSEDEGEGEDEGEDDYCDASAGDGVLDDAPAPQSSAMRSAASVPVTAATTTTTTAFANAASPLPPPLSPIVSSFDVQSPLVSASLTPPPATLPSSSPSPYAPLPPSTAAPARSVGREFALPAAAFTPLLREQLGELRRFWCDAVVVRRLSAPLAAETLAKMEGEATRSAHVPCVISRSSQASLVVSLVTFGAIVVSRRSASRWPTFSTPRCSRHSSSI
jgi:hypothetical protein